MIVNVLDLGSNSFQWFVARCDQGRVECLHQDKRYARFASSVASSQRLSEGDIEFGLKLTAQLRDRVPGDYLAAPTVAVATGAIRQADNGAEFVRRLASTLGIHARIISGEEEGRLSFRGALCCVAPGVSTEQDHNATRHAVVDLGGGSLEVAIGSALGPDGVWSVQQGMLHYLARVEPHEPTLDDLRRAGQETLGLLCHQMGDPRPVGYQTVVLACGVARELVGLVERIAPAVLVTSPTAGVRGILSCQGLGALLPKIALLSPAQLQALGVPQARCRILGIGAAVLHAVGEQLGAVDLVVARGGLREGVAWTYANAEQLGPVGTPTRS